VREGQQHHPRQEKSPSAKAITMVPKGEDDKSGEIKDNGGKAGQAREAAWGLLSPRRCGKKEPTFLFLSSRPLRLRYTIRREKIMRAGSTRDRPGQEAKLIPRPRSEARRTWSPTLLHQNKNHQKQRRCLSFGRQRMLEPQVRGFLASSGKKPAHEEREKRNIRKGPESTPDRVPGKQKTIRIKIGGGGGECILHRKNNRGCTRGALRTAGCVSSVRAEKSSRAKGEGGRKRAPTKKESVWSRGR